MISSRVVKRYAKALFEAGLESEKLEYIDQDIEKIVRKVVRSIKEGG